MNNTDRTPKSKAGKVWQLIKITFWEWWNDDMFRLAASLAFYARCHGVPIQPKSHARRAEKNPGTDEVATAGSQ